MILSTVFKSGYLLRKSLILKAGIEIIHSKQYCILRNSFTDANNFRIKPFHEYKICRHFTHISVENISQRFSYFSRGKCYSKFTNISEEINEDSVCNDPDKIKKLFPEPRVTLNILASRLPQKPFDIYYKYNTTIPVKGRKTKVPIQNDWTCTYVFQWPESRKFESTASSKRQAAESAASASLAWLYAGGRVTGQSQPVLAPVELATGDDRLTVTVSDDSAERLTRLTEMYDREIKGIYASAHATALEREQRVTDAMNIDAASSDEDVLTDDDVPTDNAGFEPHSELQQVVHPVYGRVISPPTEAALKRRGERLEIIFQRYDRDRAPLPIDNYIEQFTAALEASRTLVLAGAPGCGKSTRAPVAALRAGGPRAAALVSQPRRVAAGGLAARAAAELGEEVGETVGYQVRLQARLPRPPGGSILYLTSGVLLRRLQTNPALEGCTHVFIDEAHERDVNTDVTLLLLRRALTLNPELRLIIMSATLDIGVFTRYFEDCAVLEVPGRSYPVEAVYLEDLGSRLGLTPRDCEEASRLAANKPSLNCKEIADIIAAIDQNEPEGGILVFLPGWAEIKTVQGLLEEKFKDSGRHHIVPVHSRLSLSDQAKIFTQPPPGVRKVVLATNIAETSVTVPDVTCVVDAGARRERRIRRGASSLELTWVSRAAAEQRMGRAGRVQPGRCYKLYTREKEASFLEHTSPEILRVPLEKTVLDCKVYAPEDKALDFMSQLPEPPSEQAVASAVEDLVEIGALSSPDERLTPLGRALTLMAPHPRLGRAMLHSATLNNVDSVASVVTRLAGADLFSDAAERREEIRQIKARYHPGSDHLALRWLAAEFDALEEADRDSFCERLGLRKDSMLALRALTDLHLQQLAQTGVLGSDPNSERLTTYSEVDELTAATLLSGTDSLLRSRWYVKRKGRVQRAKGVFTSSGERAHIGTDSVNHACCRSGSAPDLLLHFGGARSAERGALVPRDTTVVTTTTALLFCGKAACVGTEVDEEGTEWSLIELPRHKLTIHVPTRQADILMTARSMLWDTFQYFIERDASVEDENSTKANEFREQLVNAIAKILVDAESEMAESRRKISR